jgi:transcriptional regulator with XRE-family HTH domain
MTIGKSIRQLRKDRNITQKKLSELTGIAEITIRQYEADKYSPKIQQVEKIATALGVTPFEIMGTEYWDASINTGQVAKEAAALDSIGAAYGEDTVQLLSDYLSLNEQGKQKATDYISDLTEQPKYQK